MQSLTTASPERQGADDTGAAQVTARFFERLTALRTELWMVLDGSRDAPMANLPDRVRTVAAALDTLVAESPDVVLCSLLLDDRCAYAEIHPAMVGALCALLADPGEFSPRIRQTLIAAALTCNIGMLDLHEQSSGLEGPLSEDQRAALHAHPRHSADYLRAAGVTDPLWLDIVTQHHERPDGSGYPLGLRGAALCRPARLVALADVYAAMVLPRQYRDGIHVQRALREIFLQRGTHIDAALAADFINRLGVFPPGIFVRLHNGETGVVIERGRPRPSAPVVSCFRAPHGGTYVRPLHRNTAAGPGYSIAEVLRRQPLPCPIPVLWAAA
ncbi:MAG: HD-GYP domain-containing protein [Gammaproteobacteria bacterium]